MTSKLCAVFLLFLAAGVVQSETTIEVDENGDEYEIKRFNIEGRKLNEGRSHCVITRRKRATAEASAASSSSESGNNGIFVATYVTSPATAAMLSAGAEVHAENIKDDTNHVENDVMQSSIISANGAAATDGIVVVQTNTPPKVNPQTHAVFELLPVNHEVYTDEDDYDYYNNYDYVNESPLKIVEDINPITTTAFWTTGLDENDQYDDSNKKPVQSAPHIRKRPSPKPGNNRKSNKPTKKPTRKPNNKRPTKPTKKPTTTKRPRPLNNKRRRVTARPHAANNNVRRRRPVNLVKRTNNQHKKNQQNFNTNNINNNRVGVNGNRRINANLLNANQQPANANMKRKKNDNSDNIDQETDDVFTEIMTTTQTGADDEDKDLNCIFINKVPEPTPTPTPTPTSTTTQAPVTTARPFWNILGRDAGSNPANGFGKRKRIVRFGA